MADGAVVGPPRIEAEQRQDPGADVWGLQEKEPSLVQFAGPGLDRELTHRLRAQLNGPAATGSAKAAAPFWQSQP